MRINRYIAQHTTYSRRKADALIEAKKVLINREIAHVGSIVQETDIVVVDGVRVYPNNQPHAIVLMHKPVGFVCSTAGQGAPTVFDLLPPALHTLKIAGRLDKDSSGLVILTNDGELLQSLTHPSNDKDKVYLVSLHKPLEDGAIARFAQGVSIGDERKSKMRVVPKTDDQYEVTIQEGRNRQIRRSFEALGYKVTSLHRIQIGPYELGRLAPKQYRLTR